jgi:hypothetical protein
MKIEPALVPTPTWWNRDRGLGCIGESDDTDSYCPRSYGDDLSLTDEVLFPTRELSHVFWHITRQGPSALGTLLLSNC